MVKPQNIKPETAAHRIAEEFCARYISNIPVPDIDSPDFHNSVKTASQIYANAYDVAFHYIAEENEAASSYDEES